MRTNFRVEITRHAEADIESIFSFIARDSPEAAGTFVAEIERQIASLARFPLRAPVIPEADDLGVTYRHLIYGNFRSIFRIERKTVYILRVIHGARLLDATILGTP